MERLSINNMSTEQKQFVKNTQKPSDNSELWAVADGWKISQQTGLTYTSLDDIFKTQNDHQFHDTLVQQLNGQIKESLDIGIGYLFVASYSQNGKALVYAYDSSRKEDADKRASYNKPQEPQQKLETVPKATAGTAVSTPKIPQATTPISTTPLHTPPQSQQKLSQVIEVPFDLQPIEWDDAMGIAAAIEDGLMPLPVKYVGVENWGFINIETGKRTFWYGRIKLVRIAEE